MPGECQRPFPLLRLLDPRPEGAARGQAIRDSVNIPAGELAQRIYELPRKGESVGVARVEPWATEAVEALVALGRLAEFTDGFEYCEEGARGRLWKPNAFLEERLPGRAGSALDLACGVGRDAVYLASAGWRVDAVDHLPDALDRGRELARRSLDEPGLVNFSQSVLDASFSPGAVYNLVTCFFFVDRPLLAKVGSWVAPGGLVLFETFSEAHRAEFGKPKGDQAIGSWEFESLFEGRLEIEIWEGWNDGRHTVRAAVRF